MMLKKHNNSLIIKLLSFVIFLYLLMFNVVQAERIERQKIKALYIPLADHYAAILAYERYRNKMKYADFELLKMKNLDFLRAYFNSGKADMAYIQSPLAMDMYQKKPNFRWIGLMHRDGSALAVNKYLSHRINLRKNRIDRKPTSELALLLQDDYKKTDETTLITVPHLLSTHTVVLYRYLKENNVNMTVVKHCYAAVFALSLSPAQSPAFIKSQDVRKLPAAFEQSLPWADIVETGGYGEIAWYSKDVMKWKNGHIGAIAVATDKAIAEKFEATKEVMTYIKIAAQDIELARHEDGRDFDEIVNILHNHLPEHSKKAIRASLDHAIHVINYSHLDIDKGGLKQIQDYAIEAGILTKPINIEEFADERFNTPLMDIHDEN
jgi:NitT/TauT family transport system substrate-binding protein